MLHKIEMKYFQFPCETPAVQMGAQCSPIPMTSAMLEFLLLIKFF